MKSTLQRRPSVDITERTDTVKIMVDHFIECLENDYIPVDDIGRLFAVERIDRESKCTTEDGELMFRVWKSLLMKSKISAESLTDALLDHRLPDFFQTQIERMKDADKCPYILELENRGFPAIKWDIMRMLTLHFLGVNGDKFGDSSTTVKKKGSIIKGQGSSRPSISREPSTSNRIPSRVGSKVLSRSGTESAEDLRAAIKSMTLSMKPVSREPTYASRVPSRAVSRVGSRRGSQDEVRDQ